MATWTIRLYNPAHGLDVTFPCREDQPILDAAEARGLALPYSCRSKACGQCAARVESGRVVLDDQYILSEGDVDGGFTLLCSATPASDCTFLTHQVDNIETV